MWDFDMTAREFMFASSALFAGWLIACGIIWALS